MPDPGLTLAIAAVGATLAFLILRPEKGLLGQWRKARRSNLRVLTEDALKYIHKSEMKGRVPHVESIAGVLQLTMNETTDLLAQIQSEGLAQVGDGGIRLTPSGRASALHIIRAHRLWERFLAEETGFDESDWHGRAEQYEHRLSPADADALAFQLGNPTHDPHGDPIPTASGALVVHGGHPLTDLAEDEPAQIVHLEDEPEAVYAQLVAERLHPGMVVRVIENSPKRIRFWADGNEHLLAPLIAANISVRPVIVEPEQAEHENLASLRPGESAQVIEISPACRGAERRRLMDLGVLPGTEIKAAFSSAGGNPVAYQIRGALIALRSEQARKISVERERNHHE
jgi:DtxR family Mn-dependent transcriptional regulator